LAQEVKTILEKFPITNAQDRALIFVPYMLAGEILAKELGLDFYSGSKDVTNEQHDRMHHEWMTGLKNTMICTSAFGTGNDHSHI
jgi:superfamily II DNA helicase RecQ